METLHQDIVLDIFTRLPAESVLNCKQVCKTWRTILRCSSKSFADMHIRRQLLLLDDDHTGAASKVGFGLLFSIGIEGEKGIRLCYSEQYNELNIDDQQYYSYKTLETIDHPPLDERPMLNFVAGSCNGLICLVKNHHYINDPIYICNPFTREYVYLPRFNGINRRKYISDIMVSGFGYNRSTNEYKVVRIYYSLLDGYYKGCVQVYTLGSGSGWRNKGETSYSLWFPHTSGIFANGALHWVDKNQWKIVAFNLEDERFHVLPSPPCFCPDGESASFALQVLGEYLCLAHQETGKSVEIWLFKKNSCYGVKDKEFHAGIWSKEFSIAWEDPDEFSCYLVAPLTLAKSSKVLITDKWMSLYGYDAKTATLKKLWDDDMDLFLVQAIPHMNSFVSLRALGEKSKIRRRTQRLSGQLK